MRRSVRMVLEDVMGEDTSGKTTKEVEHVFYGKISDAKQLAELAKQPYVTKALQEQFQTKLDIDRNNPSVYTTLRVRRVNREGCVMTRKTRTDQMEGMLEQTIEISNDVFDFMSHTIGTGIAKMRYTIQPEGWARKLELDVFLDAHGHPNGYAKFDYEVEAEDEQVPPLPVTLTNLIHFNPFKAVDAEAAQLKEFMQMQSFRLS